MTNNELFKKYLPITNFIDDWRKENDDKIYDIRYKFPLDDDIEIAYTIIFKYEIENTPIAGILMDELFTKINDNFDNYMSMTLEYRFKNRCSSCEKRRQEKDGKSYRQNNADKI